VPSTGVLGGDVVAEPVDHPLPVDLLQRLHDMRVVPVDQVDVWAGQQGVRGGDLIGVGFVSYSVPACTATTTRSAPAVTVLAVTGSR
jgi:hypothetical protein